MRTLAVVVELGRRSVRQTFRRPQLIAPLLIIPTLLLAVQSAGAGRAVDLPGFPPVESFFDFLLAGAMIQSALLAGNSGGIAMAIDIEMGFTDRLLAAPIPRFAIVAGRLAGTAAMGVVTAIWFLVLGLVFGVRIEEGPAGALLMIVLVALAALAFGTLGAALALRSGSASVVQGTFPLVFVILFLSTAFFPADLLLEPAQTIARFNPLSFIVTAVRDPAISVFSADELLAGLAGIVLVGAVGLLLCSMALRRRLRMG
ncbi:MAG: ABC transporter permease [Solirubrobacterales bacterium]